MILFVDGNRHTEFPNGSVGPGSGRIRTVSSDAPEVQYRVYPKVVPGHDECLLLRRERTLHATAPSDREWPLGDVQPQKIPLELLSRHC